MRIAWFTPTSKNTSVSGFSASILKYLARDNCIVDIYTFDDVVSDEFNEVNALILKYKVIKDHFNRKIYDHIVYNFGNNWENHGSIFELSSNIPGVAIVHDASLHHVVAYITHEKLKNKSAYTSLMLGNYGFEGARVVKGSGIEGSSPKFGPWDSPLGPNFAFLDFFIGNQKALVVHSKYTNSKLGPIGRDLPILQTRLPGDEKGCVDTLEVQSWQRAIKSKETLTLCSLGYVNQAKNLDKLIDLLSLLNADKKIYKLLILGGSLDKNYISELRKRTISYGLESMVEFALDLDRVQFDRRKIEADIFISLRFPNYEGCSAAAFESMQTGRPLICLNSGPFSEIPNNAVIKLISFEVGDIYSAVHNISSNRSKMISVGSAGQRYSSSFNSIDYANQLVDFFFKNRKIKSMVGISGFKGLSVNANFYNPKSILIDQDPEKAAAIFSFWPFNKLVYKEFQILAFTDLYRKDIKLFWDVIGHIKSTMLGRYKEIKFYKIKIEPNLIDMAINTLVTLDDKIFLITYLLIVANINISNDEIKDLDNINLLNHIHVKLAKSTTKIATFFNKKIQKCLFIKF